MTLEFLLRLKNNCFLKYLQLICANLNFWKTGA